MSTGLQVPAMIATLSARMYHDKDYAWANRHHKQHKNETVKWLMEMKRLKSGHNP